MLRKLLVVSALVLVTSPAFALVELKGGYSMHTADPSGLNDAFPANPKITQMQSISVDILADVPLMPVGLGLRYETMKRNESSNSYESTVDWKRTSIVINKRFIDTLIYLGPIATVGITNDFKYSSKSALGVTTDFKTDNQINGTIGVEAGAKLLLLRIGAEIGYMYAPMGNLKTSAGVDVTNADGSNAKVDMSGTYMRAVVGFGF